MPRHARLLRQHGDLGERLRHDTEKNVVTDLDDARELALPDVAGRGSDHLEKRQRCVVRRPRPGADERKLARLDHLRVSGNGRREQLDAALSQQGAQLGRALERNRRAFDDHARQTSAARQKPVRTGDDLLDVIPRRHHAEHDVARGKLRQRLRDFRAMLGQRLGLGTRTIPDGDVAAAFGQPRRHFVAHAAGADPAQLQL